MPKLRNEEGKRYTKFLLLESLTKVKVSIRWVLKMAPEFISWIVRLIRIDALNLQVYRIISIN